MLLLSEEERVALPTIQSDITRMAFLPHLYKDTNGRSTRSGVARCAVPNTLPVCIMKLEMVAT
jgi:hypothetical protein